mmetsp:Transcript_44508/g.129420  ORF Transcript_44508/g.129420 Transcript_44508/m.129420 type:complete len:216 (+) Transcript_44508:60-707(+)
MANPFETEIIGAAARNPKVQKSVGDAARQAARSPAIQQAALQAGIAAAAKASAAHTHHGVIEIKAYIQESRCTLRMLCFVTAVAMLASSVIGLVNIMQASFQPFHYLFNVYNIVFAATILVMEGKPGWYTRCCNAQERLFHDFSALATKVGRAAFYFYVGSINLVMLPDEWIWQVVYIVIGASLCLAGLSMLFDRCCLAQAKRTDVQDDLASVPV